METKEILQALPSLSISDRLKIAESALQLVLQEKHSLTKDEQKCQLTLAAITAIGNYVNKKLAIAFLSHAIGALD
ncbi:hypothetical protein CDG76_20960 [Nostoc sp. 'Peltigera membranacea cyanobiont' 210A]|uniref:hypothetical protein n=1 Tax=Nostoc sp. 'Peltigera membranacea cyanobiont' 210A TaxID=2014529 RepID=UPI000B95238F|nr:hypothetical protein [Nostoc sp. 'Peltigera membranacea cyanobiont' 210A]OYD93164.1 hypothetical protein CDG76_20960 [Nostoc sp. 'Peltigera membranacea cyanobiont' 210A]